MRKWHRWLGIVFSLFLIVVSVSGVAIHVEKLVNTGSLTEHAPLPGEIAGPPRGPGAVPISPGGKMPDPRLHKLLIKIHDGTFAGLFGAILSIVTGCALLFFSVSGVWMYVTMWERRKAAGRRAFFWDR